MYIQEAHHFLSAAVSSVLRYGKETSLIGVDVSTNRVRKTLTSQVPENVFAAVSLCDSLSFVSSRPLQISPCRG